MNINTPNRQLIYATMLFGLSVLLIREYTYIHPYNPGYWILGPRWTYDSTKTFTWWFLLISSIIVSTPLIRKQLIGLLGFTLLLAVLIRPIYQNKFPEQTAFEFYSERKNDLISIVNETDIKNKTIINRRIENLGFGKLVVMDGIYYFFCFDEEIPFGVCYTNSEILPKDRFTFGRNFKFRKIDKY